MFKAKDFSDALIAMMDAHAARTEADTLKGKDVDTKAIQAQVSQDFDLARKKFEQQAETLAGALNAAKAATANGGYVRR